MKVTALISDELIDRVKKVTGGKNITESLIIALTEYLQQKEISYLTQKLEIGPSKYFKEYSPEQVGIGFDMNF